MEHFSTDQFESFLKSSTENFKMQPSVRVWNSLFNKMHPGSKWPSISTVILLFFLFCFLGVNKNNFSKEIIKESTQISSVNEKKINASFTNHQTKIYDTKTNKIQSKTTLDIIETDFSEALILNNVIDSNNNSNSPICEIKHENKVENQWKEFEVR